ncbi:retropepsin-like aspartic protease [Solilutibacter silvestris]|uniref:retropepsin-like aspartic protease n=1 Tax=Solilutibacter silvestris TaxID=1645665 RepID=UPI003D339BFB
MDFRHALLACALTSAAITCHAKDGKPNAGACSLAASPASAWLVRMPFEVIDGRIYVQAKVNRKESFRFAVDTGASGMARADSSLVSTLGLKPHAQADNSDGVKTAKVETVMLDSIEIGGLARRDLEVATRDYGGKKAAAERFQGILARDFFNDGLLVIDYPRKTLYFSRSLALDPADRDVLRYERPFRIPMSIGSLQTEGNLDTGANVTFMLPKATFLQVGDKPLESAGNGTLANTVITTGESVVHGPFRLGNIHLQDQRVRVSDRIGEIYVGAHTLRNMTVMIDQRSKSIALCQ